MVESELPEGISGFRTLRPGILGTGSAHGSVKMSNDEVGQ